MVAGGFWPLVATRGEGGGGQIIKLQPSETEAERITDMAERVQNKSAHLIVE